MITLIILIILISLGLSALTVFFIVVGLTRRPKNKIKKAAKILKYHNSTNIDWNKVCAISNSIENSGTDFYIVGEVVEDKHESLSKYLESIESRMFCEFALYELDKMSFNPKIRRLKKRLEPKSTQTDSDFYLKVKNMLDEKDIKQDFKTDEILIKIIKNMKHSQKMNCSSLLIAKFIKLYFKHLNELNKNSKNMLYLPSTIDD